MNQRHEMRKTEISSNSISMSSPNEFFAESCISRKIPKSPVLNSQLEMTNSYLKWVYLHFTLRLCYVYESWFYFAELLQIPVNDILYIRPAWGISKLNKRLWLPRIATFWMLTLMGIELKESDSPDWHLC